MIRNSANIEYRLCDCVKYKCGHKIYWCEHYYNNIVVSASVIFTTVVDFCYCYGGDERKEDTNNIKQMHLKITHIIKKRSNIFIFGAEYSQEIPIYIQWYRTYVYNIKSKH